jgi:hypothetical protein
MERIYAAAIAALIVCTCQAMALKWSYKVKYGSDLDVECDDPRNLTKGALADWYKWILPNLTVVHNKWTDGNRRVGGLRGETLHIGEVKDTVYGIYHCIYQTTVNRTSGEYVLKRGVNVYGPAYDDWIEEYRNKFITGGAAAGGLLGLLCFICLIYKCRWKAPKGGKDDNASVHNGGFQDDGHYENVPTKRAEGESKF